jgi:phage terminase Nu1 subunit (DNA packaging protein)
MVTHPTQPTTVIIAKLFNITPQWVNRLSKEGIIPKVGDNKYDLATTVQAYVKHLQDKIKELQEGTNRDMDKLLNDARISKLRADKLERELGQIDSELIPTTEAMKAWGGVCQNMRSRLLVVPRKMASLTIGLKTMAEIEDVSQKLIYDVMTELSNPDLMKRSVELKAEDRARKKKHSKV